MKRYLRYLNYVMRHKWFVFKACLRLGVPLFIAIFHDWDKFLPDEFIPYAKTFYKQSGESQYNPTVEFNQAWNSHQKRNKHHWQYWMITWDMGHTECLVMPVLYVNEMIADWIGAGQALGKPDTMQWYLENRERIKLHPETRIYLESKLSSVFNSTKLA